MATTENTTDSKTMSKHAEIVCYLTDGEEREVREVADELCEDKDYLATDTINRSHIRMVRNGVSVRLSEDEYEKLSDVDDLGMRIVYTERDEEVYSNKLYGFGRRLKDDVMEGVDMTSGLSEGRDWLGYEVHVDDETIFSVGNKKPKNMGLIKGGEVPDGESVWIAEDAELPAVILTVDITDVSPRVYRWFNETVIPDIVENIKEHPWVCDKRTLSCDKEYSESGACYRL